MFFSSYKYTAVRKNGVSSLKGPMKGDNTEFKKMGNNVQLSPAPSLYAQIWLFWTPYVGGGEA